MVNVIKAIQGHVLASLFKYAYKMKHGETQLLSLCTAACILPASVLCCFLGLLATSLCCWAPVCSLSYSLSFVYLLLFFLLILLL